MKPAFRHSALLLALVTLPAIVVPTSAPANEPQIEYNAFKRLFMDQVGGAVSSQIETARRELADPNLPDGRRFELEAELEELRALDRQVKDVAMVESLYSSVKGGFKAIQDLSKELETGYGGDSSINAALMALNDLGGTDRLRQLSAATRGLDTGLDYFQKIRALRNDLAALDANELSPGAHRLASQLTVMTNLMSNFGDKVPLIGSFVKAYGDVGGGLLKATLALDGPIRESEQRQIRAGVHGDRKEMYDRLIDLGMEAAVGIVGLRDAYRTDCHQFVLWDHEARDWVVADEPGLTKEELRRRYLFFVQNGTKNPKPKQIVQTFRRTVTLKLVPSSTHITPGESITLNVSARRVLDDEPVSTAQVTVRLETHTGFRSGSFDGPTDVRVGTPVSWTSPNSENRSFTFIAELSSETDVFHSVEPARARVFTGAETQVSLTGSPRSLRPGDEIALEAQVLASDGSPLDPKASGRVSFAEASDAGYFMDRKETSQSKGARAIWVAPREPGRYVMTATYSGATSYGLFPRHLAASEASFAVEVRPPAWSLTVDPGSAQATSEEPAEFLVRLKNEDDEPQSFELAGRAGPEGERGNWATSSNLQRNVEVPGGEEHTITVRMGPRNDQASRLQAEVRARNRGVADFQSVQMTATAVSAERKVTISARGENSRPVAGGQSTFSSTAAPGTEISLDLRPWGPQREFCVSEVVERNRNMRQVSVNNHGPNGCSWGTVDGRMSASWTVDSEQVSWSGPGVRSGGGSSATFVVPDKPGTYNVTARGETKWSYVRRAPGGAVRDATTDRTSAVFRIVVE